MKVLVTGATGFIGRHVVEDLLCRNISTIVAVRDPKNVDRAHLAGRVKSVPLDLEHLPKNPFHALGEPTHCIHLAWGGLPNYKSEHHLSQSLPHSLEFLSAMIEGGLKHILVAGTCFEYGKQEGELCENTPPLPDTPYGIAKDTLRRVLCETTKTDVRIQWARLFYMYGSGQNPNSLFAQLERALQRGDDQFDMSGGEQVRDYLPVTDVAKALIDVLVHPTFTGIINICSGKKIPLREVVKQYLKERQASIKLNFGVYPYPDWEPFKFWGCPATLLKLKKGEL